METRVSLKGRVIDKYRVKIKRIIAPDSPANHYLKLLKRLVLFYLWRTRIFYRKRINKFNFDKIYWVNPDQIIYCTSKEFNPKKCDGMVVGGDWDIPKKEFVNLDVFIAFKQHFKENVKWQRTQFYKNTVQSIKNNKYHWGCQNQEEFLERCNNLDELFHSIKNYGYKTQSNNIKGFIGIFIIDEISVNIDRNGNLLFNNGAHRLSIAKLLNLKKVPIRVTVCHKLFNDSCRGLKSINALPHSSADEVPIL